MPTITKIPAVAVAVAAAAGIAAPAASSADGGARAEMREVCAKSVYVRERPGVIPIGSVHRGESVRVTRRSSSGTWARVVVSRPKRTVRGWMPVAYLCAKGRRAEFAKTSRYSVRIVNSLAGGDPGFLYVGGPANVTVTDRQRAGQKIRLCVTPAPIERSSCRTGRTGQTIDTVVWSAPVATTVRIEIEDGPVLEDTVYPYAVR